MKPHDDSRPKPRPEMYSEASSEASWIRGDGIDELLGVDPTPTLSKDAVRAIHEHLRRENDSALDGVLGLDVVPVPEGLADRVLARVASEADASRRRRRFRLLPPVATGIALAAAAALVIVVVRRDGTDAPAADGGAMVADGLGAPPSDEFLAALPALEDLEFLTEELDPFEVDALFLMDAEDSLLLDLLEMGG